ncbi:MAG: pyrroline-5-carboxylate reductase [Proteobacteria bacterium]|nr:pyrroline-5-carboxylate reductase [Pseudomonadota bacterium]
MNPPTICFIGAGNMASSLIRGLLADQHPPSGLRAADPVPAQREALAALGVTVSEDNTLMVRGADVVVAAVKPQVLGQVLTALPDLQPNQLIISICAGVPIASIESWCPAGQPVVRCMPNTPALLRAGITALIANAAVDARAREVADRILKAAGKTVWVADETQIDAVTAVSGSGPAYFFYVMEAMIKAGVDLGLTHELARELTIETAYGAALMAREGDTQPATLRVNVTSPGGTTERALNTLAAADVARHIEDAVRNAALRAQELAREFGQP